MSEAQQTERNKRIVAAYRGGALISGLAAQYGISKQRVHQIVRAAQVPPDRFCRCAECLHATNLTEHDMRLRNVNPKRND